MKPYLAALSSPSKELRGHVIEELGRMKAAEAARPMARRVVWDDEIPLRDLALRALEAIGHPDTALFLAVYLGEESVSARIRCAEAMGRFRDPRAVPPLLEALENAIETSRAMEQYGEQVTAVINRTMVLRDGSRVTLPRVVRVRAESFDRQARDKLLQEKAAILSTLGAITGRNFGEDLPRWREWMKKPK
jgi:HEAT repeat protein